MERLAERRRVPRTKEEIEDAKKLGAATAAKVETSSEKSSRIAMLIHQHVEGGLGLSLDDIYEGLARYGLRWERSSGKVNVEPVSLSEIADGIDWALGYMSFINPDSGYREAVRVDPMVEEQRDRRWKSPTTGQRFIVRRVGPESERPGIVTSALIIVDNKGNLKIEEMRVRGVPPYPEPDVSRRRRRRFLRPGGENH